MSEKSCDNMTVKEELKKLFGKNVPDTLHKSKYSREELAEKFNSNKQYITQKLSEIREERKENSPEGKKKKAVREKLWEAKEKLAEAEMMTGAIEKDIYDVTIFGISSEILLPEDFSLENVSEKKYYLEAGDIEYNLFDLIDIDIKKETITISAKSKTKAEKKAIKQLFRHNPNITNFQTFSRVKELDPFRDKSDKESVRGGVSNNEQ